MISKALRLTKFNSLTQVCHFLSLKIFLCLLISSFLGSLCIGCSCSELALKWVLCIMKELSSSYAHTWWDKLWHSSIQLPKWERVVLCSREHVLSLFFQSHLFGPNVFLKEAVMSLHELCQIRFCYLQKEKISCSLNRGKNSYLSG